MACLSEPCPGFGFVVFIVGPEGFGFRTHGPDWGFGDQGLARMGPKPSTKTT